MARYRNRLPQLSENIFLTDGGMETDLIFHEGFQLPCFAALVLLENERGIDTLRNYYRRYASIARQSGVGFILEAATWRASPDWGARLSYTPKALDDVNRKAVELLVDLRTELEGALPFVISAAFGPRGDAYRPSDAMTAVDAERYHSTQLRVIRDTQADMVTALTLTNVGEAVGIARGARAEGMPAVISFTVETDGLLPSGTSLRDAIAAVDDQTDGSPAYFGINCAHPSHFAHVIEPGAEWTRRIRMIRANASRKSHAELDEADELDDGDPREFGFEYAQLRDSFPDLTVLGGCCGTDHRHVQEIAAACIPQS